MTTYMCQNLYSIFSVFGAFTDINIWSKTLNMNEMLLWGNFSSNTEGNYLNWTSVNLLVSNMVEDTITKDEIR